MNDRPPLRFLLNWRRLRGVLFVLMCLWPTLNAAWACRMVTIIQTEVQPQRVQTYWLSDSRSLLHQAHRTEPFYQLGGQSLSTNLVDGVVPTVDGAGLVGFDETAHFLPDLYYRQVPSLSEDSQAFVKASDALGQKATVLLGHVRAKTSGDLSVDNNHPFVVKVHDGAGGTWAFMANGGTNTSEQDYRKRIKDLRLLKAHPPGSPLTDSEKLFHVLLQPVLPLIESPSKDAQGLNKTNLEEIAGTLSRTYGTIQGKIPPKVMRPFVNGGGYAQGNQADLWDAESLFLRYTPKNWVMSNGAFTFVFVHGYDQWYQVHYDKNKQATAIAFASEPTNLKEYYSQGEHFSPQESRWQQLPQDSLTVVYKEGSTLRMRLFPVVIPQRAYPQVHVYHPEKEKTHGKGPGIAIPNQKALIKGCRC